MTEKEKQKLVSKVNPYWYSAVVDKISSTGIKVELDDFDKTKVKNVEFDHSGLRKFLENDGKLDPGHSLILESLRNKNQIITFLVKRFLKEFFEKELIDYLDRLYDIAEPFADLLLEEDESAVKKSEVNPDEIQINQFKEISDLVAKELSFLANPESYDSLFFLSVKDTGNNSVEANASIISSIENLSKLIRVSSLQDSEICECFDVFGRKLYVNPIKHEAKAEAKAEAEDAGVKYSSNRAERAGKIIDKITSIVDSNEQNSDKSGFVLLSYIDCKLSIRGHGNLKLVKAGLRGVSLKDPMLMQALVQS